MIELDLNKLQRHDSAESKSITDHLQIALVILRAIDNGTMDIDGMNPHLRGYLDGIAREKLRTGFSFSDWEIGVAICEWENMNLTKDAYKEINSATK